MYVTICSDCNKEQLDKPEDSLKRNSAFTGSTFDNLNMKK